jgi:protochlorophyllide reductase
VAASGSWFEPIAYRLMDPLFQTAAMGALPQLYAATAPEAPAAGHFGPDGFGGMRGWPRSVPVAAAALNASQCLCLWQVSQELLAGCPAWPQMNSL